MANKNPFSVFKITEQKIFIEALDAEVTFRPLTMAEADAFNKRLLGDYDGKGDPKIDLNAATMINYEKVAACLVDPKMTIQNLKALPVTASKAIAEIVKAIDGREDEPEDKDTDEESEAGN